MIMHSPPQHPKRRIVDRALPLMLAVAMIFTGCGSNDPLTMTWEDYGKLSREAKVVVQRELGPERFAYIIRADLERLKGGDTLAENKMTLGELMEEGRKSEGR